MRNGMVIERSVRMRRVGTTALSNASVQPQRALVAVSGHGLARIESYDGSGQLVAVRFSHARTVQVTVPAGGFTFVRR